MKAITCILVLFALLFSNQYYAQKKELGPEVYNSWNRISETHLTANGKHAVYVVNPYRGDGKLYIVNLESGKIDSVARGYDAKITTESQFVSFKIHPGFDTLRRAELNKEKKEKWPKDTLAVWFFKNDSLVKKGPVKEFSVSEKGNTLAFIGHTNEWPTGYLSKKEQKKESQAQKKSGKPKTDGKLLTIQDLNTNKLVLFKHVTQIEVSKSGRYVAFIQQEKFKKDSLRLNVYDNKNKTTWTANKRVLEYAGLNFSGTQEQLLGLYTTDTASNKRWVLFELKPEAKTISILIDSSKVFDNNEVLSSTFKPYYNNQDSDLFFGVFDKPEKPFKDTLLESEKAKLDLWHWKDDRLQPQQLVELKRDQNRTNLFVYHTKTNEFVRLGQDSLRLRNSEKLPQEFILASSDEAYRFETWKYPNFANYYLISVSDGKIIPILEKKSEAPTLAPDQKHLVYWNENTKQFYLMDTKTQVETCITCGLNVNLLEDINGMIFDPQPIGVIGWGPEDKTVFVAAEKDIVLYDLEKKKAVIFTDLFKKTDTDTNYTYSLHKLNSDSLRFYPEYTLLVKVDKTTKAEEVYRIKGDFFQANFELIAGSNHSYGSFRKAKNSDRLLMTRASNKDYPDLYTSTKAGEDIKQISTCNPQQSQYNWSTVELIKWNSYSGIPLEGLLYKPENFDVNLEYPLLVYFYETYSDQLHNHYAPKPTASIIFPTEYASAGYVVFIPDIRYTAGHPANGAYDCIMSGTDAVLQKYTNIDPKRLGLQGQSWGGYQTAQLITMTDRYAAAMAGAPVSNMFSAFGGIRWGSGYSRQFQYEHSQSRIGKTIWDAPELYIENSPLFGLPKVKTPLLIMHNDEDGAVPWYQGIELFVGLRRLQKPVWMLNYNGDDHNLMKPANRMDLSIRMRQFFDFYLLGKAEPLWLKVGIPAIEKGKKAKYELTD